MIDFPEIEFRFNLPWPTDGRRTPGPFDPRETGPCAGDIVVSKGSKYFCGGGQGTKTANHDIKVPFPEDMFEVGSAY